jgi:putative sigma-54 modulation protein
MNISITFRHMDATEAVKGYATEKVARMQRFLRSPMKGQVTLICQHDRLHKAEVDIQAGSARFHASETSPDMYASIDKVIDKLERQIGSAKDSETTMLGTSSRCRRPRNLAASYVPRHRPGQLGVSAIWSRPSTARQKFSRILRRRAGLGKPKQRLWGSRRSPRGNI